MEMVWLKEERIKEAMGKRGVKVADLQKNGIMNRSTFQRSMNRGTMSRPKAEALAGYLGVPFKEIFGESDPVSLGDAIREATDRIARELEDIYVIIFGKDGDMENSNGVSDYDVFEARVEALAGKWDGIAPDIAVDELQGLADLVANVESGKKVKHPRKKMVNALADAMMAAEILRIHYGISKKKLGKALLKRSSKM